MIHLPQLLSLYAFLKSVALFLYGYLLEYATKGDGVMALQAVAVAEKQGFVLAVLACNLALPYIKRH